jgi:hypothetical protein
MLINRVDYTVIIPLTNKPDTILYIEDNASNIELVEQILTNKRPDLRLITK